MWAVKSLEDPTVDRSLAKTDRCVATDGPKD